MKLILILTLLLTGCFPMKPFSIGNGKSVTGIKIEPNHGKVKNIYHVERYV